MTVQLEDLEYQREAIDAVVEVLDGQIRNTFDNSNLFGIHANTSSLTPAQVEANKKAVLLKTGVSEADAALSTDQDICIEMETGTGKTLVYFRTLYELYKRYGLTKFIILVPSIAIKEGTLSAFEDFREQLDNRYGFTPACFEYDSSKLSRLRSFIEDTHPQIMVMTIQSIIGDDCIINRPGRDDSFAGKTYLDALGGCQPIIVMDEPQEGMDTEAAKQRIAQLNPLAILRYSATHKTVKNRLYRLTPFDAYQQGMVKKIEVLSVAEKNDEATLKIELVNTQTHASRPPKAKLNLWRAQGDGFKWKLSNWLKVGDDLETASGNLSYRGYVIERIYKGLHDGKWHLKFTNGIELLEKERAADFSGLFRQQLHWLIRRHFQKKLGLNEQNKKIGPGMPERGIKPLSLIFIDRVDNYIKDDGIIKTLFREGYAALHREYLKETPTDEQIAAVQGYYFARTGSGEYTESENAMLKNREIFDLILRDKETLLHLDNPVEFIFSHSALGVGWDNPNIFNIATLNQSYSEIKKRQEIGRGLRICRNQDGSRIYDVDGTPEGREINLLTVIPNETYETFAAQYQAQIIEDYGTASASSRLRRNHKGKPIKHTVRKTKLSEDPAFKEFWDRLARKTDYTVKFREDEVIRRSIEALDKIAFGAYEAEVVLTRVQTIKADGMHSDEVGRETEALRATFNPLDLVEEISENTALAYPAVFKIVQGFTNRAAAVKNPPQFLAQAVAAIRAIELDEMLRSLSYHPTGESIALTDLQEVVETSLTIEPTPNRGIYDHAICDSQPEHEFAHDADRDNEVVCFLKLPEIYEIPTPIGNYQPDFGLVLRRRALRDGTENDYYFVIETKSTNNIDDPRALTESERIKIKCALKHFEALKIEAKLSYMPYRAPVKEYKGDFKEKLEL
ncbi:MAG: DEAD/DEAH box helicase family protein [Kiritimatiellia bacterium]|jgi:type III restriction enzyme|nr:DEAD/DEAH box helicase family protein [Kiritimatiellia bacterium]